MHIWIIAVVAILIIVMDLPLFVKVVLLAALASTDVRKPSLQAYAYENFADTRVPNDIKSPNKLAKSLAFVFTPNAESGEFEEVIEGVTPLSFVVAMHTLVEVKDEAHAIPFMETPFDTLIRNNKQMLYKLLEEDDLSANYVMFVKDLQGDMETYFKKYFDMLKITKEFPPTTRADSEYENDFEFSLYEVSLTVERKIAANQRRAETYEVINPFLKIIEMYEEFKAPYWKTVYNRKYPPAWVAARERYTGRDQLSLLLYHLPHGSGPTLYMPTTAVDIFSSMRETNQLRGYTEAMLKQVQGSASPLDNLIMQPLNMLSMRPPVDKDEMKEYLKNVKFMFKLYLEAWRSSNFDAGRNRQIKRVTDGLITSVVTNVNFEKIVKKYRKFLRKNMNLFTGVPKRQRERDDDSDDMDIDDDMMKKMRNL